MSNLMVVHLLYGESAGLSTRQVDKGRPLRGRPLSTTYPLTVPHYALATYSRTAAPILAIVSSNFSSSGSSKVKRKPW